MAFDKHANFAYTSVAVAPSPPSSGTSLTVAAGTGALFPTAPFNCTVWPANPAGGLSFPTSTNAEIVRVTAVVGDVLTITRTQEGTSARAISIGDQIGNAMTVKVITDIENAIPSVPTGANPTAVVGLSAVLGSATTYMRSDASPPIDQTIAPTWTGLHTFDKDNLGGSGTVAMVTIKNATAATSGVQSQPSPALVLTGAQWNGLSSVSQQTDWRIYNNPGQGIFFQSQIAGAGFNNQLQLTEAGTLTIQGGLNVGTITESFTDSATSTATTMLTLTHSSSGTAAAGFGSKVVYNLTDSSNLVTAHDQTITWATATHGSQKARVVFNVYDTAARNALQLDTDGTNPTTTISGTLSLAANCTLSGVAGTGALSLGSMTGDSNFPTGQFNWAGASGKTASIVATAAAITITAAAASTWKTTTSSLTIDAATSLNLGTSTATTVNAGNTSHTTQINLASTTTGAINLTGGSFTISGQNATCTIKTANATAPAELSIITGDSSSPSTNPGGYLYTHTGAGAAGTVSYAGTVGGKWVHVGGKGGIAAGSYNAAAGGPVTITGGAGGDSNGTRAAATGGVNTFQSGPGGAGSGSVNPGAGGTTQILGGNGGTGGTGNSNGGGVNIDAGTPSGSGVGGNITIAAAHSASVLVGNATTVTAVSFQTTSGGTIGGASNGQTIQNVSGTSSGIPVHLMVCGRPTLTSGVPVTSSDVTAATGGYYTPYEGNVVVLYDGSIPRPVTFSELAWLITDSSQTGGSISGTTITGLTDTSKLFAGMKLSASTGTGTLAANTTISTIVSATSITVNNAASVNGTLTNLTFKMPANSNLDWYGVYSSGAMVLRPGTLWTNQTTEADTVALVNGRWMNTSVIRSGQSNTIAANQGLRLFTVATNGTDGTTDDAGGSGATPGSRLLLSWYKPRPRNIQMCPGYVNDNASTTWTTTSTSWTAANAGVNSTFKFLSSGEYEAKFHLSAHTICGSAGIPAGVGIGIDTTTSPVVSNFNVSTTANSSPTACNYDGILSLGVHSISFCAVSFNGSSTVTYYADIARVGASADPMLTYITGTVWT